MKRFSIHLLAAFAAATISAPAHADTYLCGLASRSGVLRIYANSNIGAQLQMYQALRTLGHPAGSVTMRGIRCRAATRPLSGVGRMQDPAEAAKAG